MGKGIYSQSKKIGEQHKADWAEAGMAQNEQLPDDVRGNHIRHTGQMHKEEGSTPPPADSSTTRS